MCSMCRNWKKRIAFVLDTIGTRVAFLCFFGLLKVEIIKVDDATFWQKF